MQLSNETELYNQFWQRFQTINNKDKFPHALLLIGSETANLLKFSYEMASSLLCLNDEKPCNQCKSCHLIKLTEHPDLRCLEPDKEGGLIKIEQIRELLNLAYCSPQIAKKRIFIFYPAEKMNNAAANALLKLLEEPPSDVFFILIAEQISSIPATIISRCQLWRFAQTNADDYLTSANNCLANPGRELIFEQLPSIIDGFIELMANKISSCSLAVKWSTFDFNHLIWLIHLLNCQLILYKFSGISNLNPWTEKLSQLNEYFQPLLLFQQLNELNAINKNLRRNINLNQQLVLENLLLGYKSC